MKFREALFLLLFALLAFLWFDSKGNEKKPKVWEIVLFIIFIISAILFFTFT